ncbi:MAG: sugar ABC transporter ATP-binding protein [Phycisphaerae bacterium]|nr:sugar ABC transporter ATP-binding protein [Phycisphaerae bacterium]
MLEMRNIEKRFGGTAALAGVDLCVAAGEIHALLGENGAGKSTLMRILAGAVAPDAGSIALDGRPFAPRSPIDARRAGVAMIYQELTLAPHLSVAANIRLGRERTVSYADVRNAMDAIGLAVDLDAEARTLPPAERQLVEIARVLVGAASKIVVLDEPTSSLGPREAERVFTAIRRLRELGRSIVFISHHLDEVRAVCERYTILRDGRSVETGSLADVTDDQLVERMAGRPVDQVFPPRRTSAGDVVLEVRELAGVDGFDGASLSLRRGEILGIAGLVGAGRTEFVRALYGLDPVRSGSVTIGAWTRERPAPRPYERLARGMGMLSEDRKSEGLALRLSLATNTMLPSLGNEPRSGGRFGIVRQSSLGERTRQWFDRLAIKARDPWQLANELSGGNQQKIALARLLERNVDIFVLDEPTRGIDVGSKMQIYRLLAELAAEGKAILVVSSVTSELLGLCDRIAVMTRGRLGPPRPAGECTEETILRAASGIA